MVGIAKLVIAPGCGPGGRGFESHYSPQNKKNTEFAPCFSYSGRTNRFRAPPVAVQMASLRMVVLWFVLNGGANVGSESHYSVVTYSINCRILCLINKKRYLNATYS